MEEPHEMCFPGSFVGFGFWLVVGLLFVYVSFFKFGNNPV